MSALQVVVMGVSGCGKSTVGAMLAQAMRAEFIEGDELHSPDNVAKMAAGSPLTDADREGWLHTIASRLSGAHDAQRSLVASCSALKRSYRDILREGTPGLRFVYLEGNFDLLGARLAARVGHYMPASLLASQFATLEPPGADERAIVLDCRLPAERLAAQALDALMASTKTSDETSR